MSVYGRMLVGAGGGLINPAKQSERNEDATLIIGLGGTGSSAVTKIKREIYQQLKPDDPSSAIPKYGPIKFLVVDSDLTDLKRQQNGTISDIDENNEFFDISNVAIKEVFADKETLKYRHELSWLNYENIHPDTAKAGAGGIRQLGRYLLVDKAEKFYAKIQTLIASALREAKGSAVNVHILAGISGGTGSGTFLDVCYLVRKALNEAGKTNAQICGYFFMPDVNISVPAVQSDPLISSYIKVNGYAALQELDYCMNFSRNGDKFHMDYSFMSVDDNTAPVDLAYLVSTTNQSGVVLQNGYQYAMGVVADYIINFLAQVNDPEANGADDKSMTLQGHIANINRITGGIQMRHGAGVCYNVLGASVAIMPFTEIATYLGAKLFASYKGMYDRMPFQEDVDDFVYNKAKIGYEQIIEALVEDCIPRPILGEQYNAALFSSQNNKPFIAAVDEYYNKNKGTLARNASILTTELGDYDIKGEGTSLISRTFKQLFETYVVSYDFGPIFANRILYGQNNPNIVNTVEGMIARCIEDIEAKERQIPLRERDLRTAEAKMNEAGFLNKNSRCEEYKNALCAYYRQLYEAELFNTLKRILITFKDLLNNLDIQFFQILTKVLESIRETFELNVEYLEKNESEESIYQWKILKIKDIKKTLDKIVENTDLQHTVDLLMHEMFINYAAWIGQDVNEITKLITKFVYAQFHEATERTMEDYLRDKFNVQTPEEISAAIQDKILQDPLWLNSSPLFWQNSNYGSDTGNHSTLTVPYDSTIIVSAAQNFVKGQDKAVVRPSSINDKISVMRFISGLPMFAYQGIHEYERAYENDRSCGRHLFETEELDWNKVLPSPIPASYSSNKSSERIKGRNEALQALFAQGKDLGVITEGELGENVWYLHETKPLDVSALKAELDAAGKRADAEAVVAKIEALAADIKATEVVKKLEGGKPNLRAEEGVMMDFFMLSPVTNSSVRAEVAKKVALNELLAEAATKVGEVKDLDAMLGKFRLAIFSGVISYERKITFKYLEHGIERVVELQNLSMPYGRTGAYQAYLTYQELDPAIRAKIDTLADKAGQPETDEEVATVGAIVHNLEDMMPELILTYEEVAQETHYEKADEIKKFYQDFMVDLGKFKRLNRL